MAELVDALDSKSNVLKKTCRFEPGFGHKKMRVKERRPWSEATERVWGTPSPMKQKVPSGHKKR